MTVAAIEIVDVSKIYRRGSARGSALLMRQLFQWFAKRGKNRQTTFVALESINLTLQKGEILGIVGPNGAGKSTILKILSGITYPTTGEVVINGTVASLLEVGTGFHEELTGAENIELNGTLMGMRLGTIRKLKAEIIAYSGLEHHINEPVKTYSTGMKMRLAFSIAAHLDADILLIDEVLAVGDANFQRKCLRTMDELKYSGRTIIFVSHNLTALKNICTQCIYLRNGKILAKGAAQEVIEKYLSSLNKASAELSGIALADVTEYSMKSEEDTFQLSLICVKDEFGESKTSFNSAESIILSIGLSVLQPIKDLRIVFSLLDEDNQYLLSSQVSDNEWFVHAHHLVLPGQYVFECTIPANLLGENTYYISVEIINPSIEHAIVKRAIPIHTTFSGYNNVLVNSYGRARFRPFFNWTLHADKPTHPQ